MSSDTKQALRNLKFPCCVKEALSRIEQLCTSNAVPNVGRIQNCNLAMELITEFVFCEIDRRGEKKKKLNHIQEMQLVEVLSDYFAFSHNITAGGDAARNTVFMSLFPHTCVERCQLLVKLVSIAVCTNNIPLLSATGVLMQQIGCTSKFSVELAKGLINDYFILLPNASNKLRDLPCKAPLFTANFLTALSEIYFDIDPESLVECPTAVPSSSLLNIITEWVSDNNSLCYAALTNNLLLSLPMGGIPMPAVTPFVGLFKWCVLAPLYVDEHDLIYSKLHLALLESLLEAEVFCPSPSQRNVISVQHVTALVKLCNNKIERILQSPKIDSNGLRSRVQLCLERLAQFVQVALHTNSIYGSKQDLIARLKTLPKNRLLRITLSRHKEII
ncbi:integrator complex subunit 15 [Planococcus citri]|uniref:integrator complex subunit 15 n=1 Tax=Planococcus citri TaxID=170843 RepID=UPI0031F92098